MGNTCGGEKEVEIHEEPEVEDPGDGSNIKVTPLEKQHRPYGENILRGYFYEVPDKIKAIYRFEGPIKYPENASETMKPDVHYFVLPVPYKYSDQQNSYRGGYLEGKKNGIGIQTGWDGTTYEGYWRDDKEEGFGRLFSIDGTVYSGHWSKGKKCGYGILKLPDGRVYSGTFANDLLNGEGQEVILGGSLFKGRFRDGMKNGHGQFSWEDGRFYEGEFLNDNMCGMGYYEYADGRFYKGTFKLNKMDGVGSFVWPEGDYYEGEYKNDLKHGFGILTTKDDLVYRGEWEMGKEHGKGFLIYPDGTVLEGEFEKSIMKSSLPPVDISQRPDLLIRPKILDRLSQILSLTGGLPSESKGEILTQGGPLEKVAIMEGQAEVAEMEGNRPKESPESVLSSN